MTNKTKSTKQFYDTEIPEDWAVKLLGDELESLEAGVSVNSNDDKIHNGDLCILKTSAISDGKFNAKECKKILKSDIQRARVNPQKDSIIISRMNTPNLVGECGFVEETYSHLFLPDRLWQTKFHKESNVFPQWLNYLLNTPEYKLKIKGTATGTSNSMKNISKDAFLGLKIPLPPFPEQKAIASVLSTWDDAIYKIEQLITQKELRNKWLMQQLLTGKKRLMGFDEEWKEVRLGNVCDFVNGMAFKPEEWKNVGIPIIRIQNLNGSKEFNYCDKDVIKKHLVEHGDLLFAWSGSRGTSFGAYRWFGGVAVLNQHIFNVYSKNGLNRDFAFQILRWLTIEIERKAHGSAGLVHVTKKQLENELMEFPKAKLEQTAIAQVLEAADKEISLFRAKAHKLREQKKGLMQMLLTGKKRLKI